MTWKDERIERYGEAAYEKKLEQMRQWVTANPEKGKERSHNQCRKGGKHYEKTLEYERAGLRGERNKIRGSHNYKWGRYKKIIAPDSQLHHEWIPKTSEYNGVALVEKEPHQYGIIDVIKILDGEITLLTEKDILIQPPGHKSQSSSPASGNSISSTRKAQSRE